MTHKFLITVAGLALIAGCDRAPDNSPAQLKPPPLPAQPAPVASAAPAEVPAVTPVVSTKVPAGIVVDQWAVGGACTIDTINAPVAGTKPVVLEAGAPVKISGWAYDSARKKLPDAVHVRFASPAGTYYGTAALGVNRADVAKADHLPASLNDSGFELNFDAKLLPAGDYSLILLIHTGEKTYICDNGRKIHVES